MKIKELIILSINSIFFRSGCAKLCIQLFWSLQSWYETTWHDSRMRGILFQVKKTQQIDSSFVPLKNRDLGRWSALKTYGNIRRSQQKAGLRTEDMVNRAARRLLTAAAAKDDGCGVFL